MFPSSNIILSSKISSKILIHTFQFSVLQYNDHRYR